LRIKCHFIEPKSLFSVMKH